MWLRQSWHTRIQLQGPRRQECVGSWSHVPLIYICNVINYWCLHAGSLIFGKHKLSVAQLIALQGFVTICTNHWSCWTNKVSEESSCCFWTVLYCCCYWLVQQTRIYADQQGAVEFELYRELLLSLLWTVQWGWFVYNYETRSFLWNNAIHLVDSTGTKKWPSLWSPL